MGGGNGKGGERVERCNKNNFTTSHPHIPTPHSPAPPSPRPSRAPPPQSHTQPSKPIQFKHSTFKSNTVHSNLTQYVQTPITRLAPPVLGPHAPPPGRVIDRQQTLLGEPRPLQCRFGAQGHRAGGDQLTRAHVPRLGGSDGMGCDGVIYYCHGFNSGTYHSCEWRDWLFAVSAIICVASLTM